MPVLSSSNDQLELPELDKRWWNLNWPWSSYESTYRVLGADMIITVKDTDVTVPRAIIMHKKIKVIYGLGAEVHEFEVAALMTLNELQGKLDEIHDHVSPAVKRYQFMAAGQLDTPDITFELNNKIRDIADLFEAAEIYLRALRIVRLSRTRSL